MRDNAPPRRRALRGARAVSVKDSVSPIGRWMGLAEDLGRIEEISHAHARAGEALEYSERDDETATCAAMNRDGAIPPTWRIDAVQ
ncbi:hypothetical protein [Nannocystis punicea]|uniref:Amidase n=1 Tax=Nannocystis punicea TaxID=2995304 RepID=A0ABY7H3T8_9BACT|nr:hypothetical protein [Nannocystis poenicansa]WAS93654.1 hypothetical protein O0S08_46575 [Nannocystis poenicansa]